MHIESAIRIGLLLRANDDDADYDNERRSAKALHTRSIERERLRVADFMRALNPSTLLRLHQLDCKNL